MDKELILIMKLLLERTLLTIRELEDATGLSTRQITYRIEKINDLLKSKKAQSISLKYNKEIILSPKTKDAIIEIINQFDLEKYYYLSKDERLIFIYLTLFINLDYTSLNHFTSSMKVSRSIVLLDLKELKHILGKDGIVIKNNRTHGYYLDGSEMVIRRQMIKFIIGTLSTNHDYKIFNFFIDEYKLDSFDNSKEIIAKLAHKHNIKFVEDRLQEFIYIFIFLKARMTSLKTNAYKIPNLPNISIMKSLKEYSFTESLLHSYNNGDKIKPFDVSYISAWIIGISVGNINENTEDILIITEIVFNVMTRFESLSGFHYVDRIKIFEQLYAHFRPAYYRLIFKLPIFNPLCERVKEEYNGLYKLVSETMKPISQQYNLEMTDDELAFLTMHFGAILFNGKKYMIPPKKTALIVCSGGVGSSAILYTELKNLLPEINFLLPIELSKLKDIDEHVDIIFTCNNNTEIMKSGLPVIVVSPVMTLKEKYQVKREVSIRLNNAFAKEPRTDEIINIVKKYATINSESMLYNELQSYLSKIENVTVKSDINLMLSNIVNQNLIRLKVMANDWEDAIRKSASVLYENNIVTAQYIESMIKYAKESGPYIVITKHVALPHAKPEDGAKKTAIGICVLKQPIEFGNKDNDPVKYVFCLSAIDHESHLQAMAELLELLERDEFYDILNNAEDPEAIMKYIRSYEINNMNKKSIKKSI